jgi:hypothetical protein
MQSIKSVEEAWNDNMNVKQDKTKEEESECEEVTEQLQLCTAPQGFYVTRSGHISRPPDAHLIETAYAMIQETYLDNFCEKPLEAMKALKEEVIKAIKIDIWDPVHPKDMSAEERKLIIPQMMNYLEIQTGLEF